MSPTKILVVDDEPDLEHLIRQKFRRNVRNGEFALVFASDGVEALNQLEDDEGISVVLTDINMPEMDGLTLLSRLSDLDRLITAVVVSAYGDMENIRLAMNRGSFDFLTKPIDLNDLEITLRKAIDVIESRRQADQARETFGKYVSDEVVNKLLSSPEALELGGEIRNVTLLMCDIRGFTTATMGLQPHTVVDVLNVFLGKMVDVVRTFGGTVDNFLGDGLLIVFGAPIHMDDDCFRAAACAVAMQLAMEEVNQKLVEMEVHPLAMGIGIHSGDVIVGNIGSKFRMKYSVVGSGVNLVSRVESSTVGGQVLITDDTKAVLGDKIQTGQTVAVGVKGFAEKIRLHELTGVHDPYNIFLEPFGSTLAHLSEPLPVTIHFLSGKSRSDNKADGVIAQLSRQAASIQCDEELPQLSDLLLMIGSDTHGIASAYAKVVDTSDESGATVRFTGLSGSDASQIEAWTQELIS